MDRIWVLVGFVMFNGLGTVSLTLTLVPHFGVTGALLAYGAVTVLVWSWAGVALFRRLMRDRAEALPMSSSEPVEGLW